MISVDAKLLTSTTGAAWRDGTDIEPSPMKQCDRKISQGCFQHSSSHSVWRMSPSPISILGAPVASHEISAEQAGRKIAPDIRGEFLRPELGAGCGQAHIAAHAPPLSPSGAAFSLPNTKVCYGLRTPVRIRLTAPYCTVIAKRARTGSGLSLKDRRSS